MEANFSRPEKIPEKIKERAAIHAALGEPARLAIVDSLRVSDRSPSSLAQWLGMDSNLMAHHLDVLASVGLIERIVSSGDRRRRYVTLKEDVLKELFPVEPLSVNAVLFLCTHNSAPSQLAAALWNRKALKIAESAGTHPAPCVHPLAIDLAARYGIDLSTSAPRSFSEVTMTPDLIVTVCDRANEELVPSAVPRMHWSIPDPAEAGTLEAFQQVFQALEHRINILSERTLT
jgi:protein-tyrosine-phosphatase/DNA-binding HxlR family transcriptional regulator